MNNDKRPSTLSLTRPRSSFAGRLSTAAGILLVCGCEVSTPAASGWDTESPGSDSDGSGLGSEDPTDSGTDSVDPESDSVDPGTDSGSDSVDPESTPDDRFTPLARLTNVEFTAAVASLLGIAADAPELAIAEATLVGEVDTAGLNSDALQQNCTQVALAGYTQFAAAAAEVFLEDVANVPQLEEHLECEALKAEQGLASGADYPLAQCHADFAANLLRRGFRGGATEEDLTRLTSLLEDLETLLTEDDANGGDLAAYRIRFSAVVHHIATSPKFLLFVEQGVDDDDGPRSLTPHEVATRLAFFLTGNSPDAELIAAAEAGQLATAAQRVSHADRLLGSDPGEAPAALAAQIIMQWLGTDPARASAEAIAELREFVVDWVDTERPFADFYQAPVTVDHTDGTQTVEPFGVLGTQGYLASHTSHPTPSFINRGEFLVERLLCSALPDDVPDDALNAGSQTPLEVFTEHVENPCASCHVIFDKYGAAFQRFDSETNLYDPQFSLFGDSFELFPLGDVSGCHSSGYLIASSSAERIGLSSAERIGPSSADRIAIT